MVTFNYGYRRIFVQFPPTKAHLAHLLKAEFGGSVYVKPYTETKNTYTCFELKSKAGLRKLQRAVAELDGQLPIETIHDLRDYLAAVL